MIAHVQTKQRPVLNAYPISELIAFVAALLNRAGLTREDAVFVAGVLVGQEACGVTTHGLRLVEFHVWAVANGAMNPRPNIRVLRDDSAVVVLDVDNAVGILGATHAMDAAIERAERFGVGIAVAAYSSYCVSVGPYCLYAAERDMLGIAMSNTQPAMGYPGAMGRVIGNNPLAFAAPTGAGYPMVFDAAMTISGGMLSRLVREGLSLPAELAGLDADGNPTRNPGEVTTPMPIGGGKGAGLALLVEILTGVLGGGAFLRSVIANDKPRSKSEAQSQCCIAVDIQRFMPLTLFQQRMTQLISTLKDNPLVPGATEIRVPGERLYRRLEESRRDGVVVDADVVKTLRTLAQQQKVQSPF